MFMNRFDIVKMSVCKVICRFNAIPIKIQMTFFAEVKKKKKTILKFVGNLIAPRIAKIIF